MSKFSEEVCRNAVIAAPVDALRAALQECMPFVIAYAAEHRSDRAHAILKRCERALDASKPKS